MDPLEELVAAQAAENAAFHLDAEWATARWAHGDQALSSGDVDEDGRDELSYWEEVDDEADAAAAAAEDDGQV